MPLETPVESWPESQTSSSDFPSLTRISTASGHCWKNSGEAENGRYWQFHGTEVVPSGRKNHQKVKRYLSAAIFLNQWIAFSWKRLSPTKIFYFQQILMDRSDFILLKKAARKNEVLFHPVPRENEDILQEVLSTKIFYFQQILMDRSDFILLKKTPKNNWYSKEKAKIWYFSGRKTICPP